MDVTRLQSLLAEWGAEKVALISAELVSLNKEFRQACRANHCGYYGKCWMCPPDVGSIESLMAELKQYQQVLVFQTVSALEDSYDIEGMSAAASRHSQVVLRLRKELMGQSQKHLLLGAGGCHLCEVCAKVQQMACRFPDLAIPSLEAYGVHVAKLAEAAEMNYINGVNTVTYFGALFF